MNTMYTSKFLLGPALILSIGVIATGPVKAQQADQPATTDTTAAEYREANRNVDRDDGFDWGLLGLLGLLGLIPRKRADVVVHDANRHNPSGPNRT